MIGLFGLLGNILTISVLLTKEMASSFNNLIIALSVFDSIFIIFVTFEYTFVRGDNNCRAQVQVQVRSRSGEDNSKFKDLDLSQTLFLVSTCQTCQMDLGWVGMTQMWSEWVRASRWTPSQISSGTTGGTSRIGLV